MAQQINLYNPALRRQREWLTLTNVAAVSALFGCLLIAFGFALQSKIQGKKAAAVVLDARLNGARAGVLQLGGQAGKTAAEEAGERELGDLKQQVATRREVLAALQGGGQLAAELGRSDSGFADYLRGLARQSVRDLWLTGFSVGQGGDGLEVRGRMLSPGRLPEYIKRLNGEATFKGRQFVSLNISTPEKVERPGAATGTRFSSFVLTAVPAKAGGDKRKEGGR